jgi:hypothetical protein
VFTDTVSFFRIGVCSLDIVFFPAPRKGAPYTVNRRWRVGLYARLIEPPEPTK